MTSKKQSNKKVEILGKEEKVDQPKTETKEPKNALSPSQQAKELTRPVKDADEVVTEGTVAIPLVKEHVDKPDKNEEISEAEPDELAFGNFTDDRSMKFKINPEEVKAPAYCSEDFRGFFQKYEEKKGARPNVLFINTTSLEKLGYRDVATDLGLHIKEGTSYKTTELVLAIDL